MADKGRLQTVALYPLKLDGIARGVDLLRH
jgi:hypothetical protein